MLERKEIVTKLIAKVCPLLLLITLRKHIIAHICLAL